MNETKSTLKTADVKSLSATTVQNSLTLGLQDPLPPEIVRQILLQVLSDTEKGCTAGTHGISWTHHASLRGERFMGFHPAFESETIRI